MGTDGEISSVTMTGSGKIITVNCPDGIDLTTAQTLYIPIPAVTLSAGFQVVVRSDDYKSMGLKSASTLSKNMVTKMPSITYVGTWTSYGRANCVLAYGLTSLNIDVHAHPVSYQAVTPEASEGGYRKADLTINKIETVPATAEVVWQESGLTFNNPVISDNVLSITGITGTGNALVAIKDANGTILWNFVIWKPEMDPIGTDGANLLPLNSTGTVKMMKPFLGAMRYYTDEDNNAADDGDYGLLFQFGRVEPISYKLHPTTPFPSSYRIALTSDEASSFDAALYRSRREPDFIYSNWPKPSQPALIWHRSGKSYLDPCPEGYKMNKGNDYKWATSNLYSYTFTSSGMLYKDSDNSAVLFEKGFSAIFFNSQTYDSRKRTCWWNPTYGSPDTSGALSYAFWETDAGGSIAPFSTPLAFWGLFVRCCSFLI